MGINIEIEEVISPTEATRVLLRVNGKLPARSTLWRWRRRGLRGFRLEYIRVGRNVATSRQALNRFFTALAEADEPLEAGPAETTTRISFTSSPRQTGSGLGRRQVTSSFAGVKVVEK